MANAKGSTIRTVGYNGKQSLLPPKSPFPSISPSYVEYTPVTTTVGAKNAKPTHHQRTSSESQMEEQPSWLDDLLNEPETPVRRGGHRRSSSDSFAHFKLDANTGPSFDYAAQDEFNFNNMVSVPSWGTRDFDHYAMRPTPFYVEPTPVGKPRNRAVNPRTHSARPLPAKENISAQISGLPFASKEGDKLPSSGSEKQNPDESVLNDQKAASDKDSKSPASETETKRAKQQFAQRSRVRKLQYIAELERNVQVLQAEGSEVSAELGFLSQQNLILSMENKALRQRLENLAQEQLIKHLEHEMLEREMGRLQGLYQLQQQQHQPSSSHKRSNSKDLDKQFANLSLMKQDSNLATDPIEEEEDKEMEMESPQSPIPPIHHDSDSEPKPNHSSVDTSRPFSSVKEAVAIFGERLISGELYSYPRRRTSSFISFSEIQPAHEDTPRNHFSGFSSAIEDAVRRIEADLEQTKAELKILKMRESETEVILASLNAELYRSMSIIARAEAVEAAMAREATGRDGMREKTATLGQILNCREDERLSLERGRGKVEKMDSKKKKKKPIMPLLLDFLSRKKKGSSSSSSSGSGIRSSSLSSSARLHLS